MKFIAIISRMAYGTARIEVEIPDNEIPLDRKDIKTMIESRAIEVAGDREFSETDSDYYLTRYDKVE